MRQQQMGSGRDAIARALIIQHQANQQQIQPNRPPQPMSAEEYERQVQQIKEGVPPERGQWPQQFHEQMNQQMQQVQQAPPPQSNMPIMQGDPDASSMTPDMGGGDQGFASQMQPSFEDQFSGGGFGL